MKQEPELFVGLDGTKFYRLDGEYHREDGPAYEADRLKCWYLRGKRHRTDGPAVEWSDGHKRWFFNGKEFSCSSQDEFERLLKLKAFW